MNIEKNLKGYIKIAKGNRDSFSRKNTFVCVFVCMSIYVYMCIYVFFPIFFKFSLNNIKLFYNKNKKVL